MPIQENKIYVGISPPQI